MILARLLAPLALLLAVAPAAHAADRVIARVDAPTPIAADRGLVAYSVRAGGDGFALVLRTSTGVTTRAPVPTRSVPFDVDLGPDADGRTVAVYSRCDREPPVGAGGAFQYHLGRGCDVYRFDVVAGRERRVAAASSPTASEYWPSIWRERIAFGRTYDRKRDYPYVYVKDLGGGASRRQPGGQRERCSRNRRTRRLVCSDDRRSAPMALELFGPRLAFGWRFQGFGEGASYELRLDTVSGRGRARRVAAAGDGGLTQTTVGWPAFEAGRLYWPLSCFGDGSGCPRRYALQRLAYGADNAVAARARPPERDTLSHDRDGGTTYVLVDRQQQSGCAGDPAVSGGTCELVAVQPDYVLPGSG